MKTTLFILLNFIIFLGYSQTGPGGVGNSTDNIVWLDANNLSLSNNDPVSSWTDLSGNTNNASAIGVNRPIFKTSQINGKPAIQFDGINDRLTFNSNITTDQTSIFIVYNGKSSNVTALIAINKHLIFSTLNKVTPSYFSPQEFYPIDQPNNSFGIFSMHTSSAITGAPLRVISNNSAFQYTRTELGNKGESSLGARVDPSLVYGKFFNGLISEVIIYNYEVNSAQRKIISNSLGAKYNQPTTNLYSYSSTHGNEVLGIGQESDGSNLTAQGTGIIEVSNASAMGNGDYLLIGHDGAGLGTTASVGALYGSSRYSQIWRVGVTNTPGTVDLKFSLAGNNFAIDPITDYRLLIDNNTGVFDNSGVSQSISGTYNAIDETITFSGVTLTDGEFITLAVRPVAITAVSDGDWDTPATWSCNCIPTSSDDLNIPSPFTVDINGATANASDLSIEVGGSINFLTNDSLLVQGDLLNNGTISSTTGLIGFNGTSAQELWNNSGSAVTLFNFYANNAANVSLRSGEWNITNFIKVASGQLVNDGATVTLVSDAGTHAQIQPSATNSFSGEFILQRFFSARNANYADITAGLVSTTIADWDNELFMSGVGGLDGDARDGVDGPIYRSVTKYNNTTKAYIYVTSTAETIVAGEGIELFLGDNLSTFSAQTMDSRGTPYTGPISITLKPGFNFIANPYSCFINYSTVTKPSGVTNQFYVYVQNSGAYQLFTGGFIAANQGFWVNNASGVDRIITFNESNKFPLATSLISKQKEENKFALKISSLGNGFGNELTVTPSVTAANGLDTEDEYYLPSPHKATTALTAQPIASSQELIGTAINSADNNQSIPVAFTAGENGSYTIAAKDVSELLSIYSCVLLEDKTEGKVIDLNSTANYTFASTTGKYDRFNLHLFKSAEDCKYLLAKTGQNQSATPGISILKKGDIVQLDFNVEEGKQAQIDIYNLNGQKVAATQFIGMEGTGSQQIDHTRALKGIHLIVVRTNNEVITEKFNF